MSATNDAMISAENTAYRKLKKASSVLLLAGVIAFAVGVVAYLTQINAVQVGPVSDAVMLFATYGMFFGLFGGVFALFAALLVRIVAAIKR